MDDSPPFEPPRPRLVPSSPSSDRVPAGHALPLVRTPLIGRERDVASISELVLRDDVPLVTLTGPGGVGKTRLALQVTAGIANAFSDGARFLELAPVHDEELVLPTIANALGLSNLAPRGVVEQLVAYLRPRQMLLVLDNLEQVASAASHVSELLALCPHLTVLATSRVVLHVSGEHDVAVAPLPVPAAVQLFVARARAATSTFVLTADNASTVAALCARLDGLPLAIELAAARVRVLPPDALMHRLEPTLPLLTGGSRDGPDRLRTMRAAIAWSYDLLTPLDQILLGRLAVFVGGFALASAEAICAQLPSALRLPPSHTMLDVVQSLVENSLLRQAEGWEAGEPRFEMLETVREFGLERLGSSGYEPVVRAAHAAHMLTLTRDASRRMDDPDYELVLHRLDAEHDNVRAALAWAESAGEAELCMQLAETMARYWAIRGHYREGRSWLQRALAIDASTLTPIRLQTLRAAGWLARLQGASDDATALQGEALRASRSAGDSLNAAAALQELSLVNMHRGAYDRAVQEIAEALALLEAAEATTPAGAHLVSVAHANMGQICLAQGDATRAWIHADEAVRRQRDLGYTWALGDTLRILGDVALIRGEASEALAAYRESVELTRDHGDRRFLTNALAGIAGVAAAQGQAEQAARLFGATIALRDGLGLGVESWQAQRHERAIAMATSLLSSEAFAQAWSKGESLPLEEAIVEALSVEGPAAGAVQEAGSHTVPALVALTAREVEVLRLIAKGLQDKQIADVLFISRRTASYHVANLLSKLNVDTRAAAAAYAVREGFG